MDEKKRLSYTQQEIEGNHADAQTRSQLRNGIIDSITLVNFMCHKHLFVAFGPRINFVIGHNGSGKSAILTALSICLGSKAASTNRATSLRHLIREGETFDFAMYSVNSFSGNKTVILTILSHCEVKVKIRNRGPDGFKPDDYGNQVIIVRKISTDNGSSYSLRSESNKVISTKREELVSICDHFAIQPDNPLLILTQDSARQFLASSTAEERYKVFVVTPKLTSLKLYLRGTQLSMLTEDYALVRQSLVRLEKLLVQKRKMIPDFQADCDSAQRRLRDLQQAMNLEKQILNLKRQIAWCQVYEHLHAVHSAREKLDKLQARVDRISAQLKIESESSSNFEQLIKAHDCAIDAKEKEASSIQARSEQIRLAIEDDQTSAEEREMNMSIVSLKHQMAQVTESINTRVAASQAESSEVLSSPPSPQTLELLNKKLASLQSQLNHLQPIDPTPIHSLEGELDKAQQNFNFAKNEWNRVQGASNSRIRLFGRGVEQMLAEMASMTFGGGKPVGPIGYHILLKDPQWKVVVDALISHGLAHSFIVQDARDVEVLQRLFQKHSYGFQGRDGKIHQHHDIIVRQLDRSFTYEQGMPENSTDFRIALDQLNIDEELVQQVVIDQCSLEGIILVDDRNRGECVMSNWPRNVIACFDKDANKIGDRGGGNANFNMARSSGNQAGTSLSLFINDQEAAVGECSRNLSASQTRLDRLKETLTAQKERLRIEQNDFTQKSHSLQAETQSTRQELRTLSQRLAASEASPINDVLQGLEEERVKLHEQIQLIKIQFPSLVTARQSIHAHVSELSIEANEIHAQLTRHNDAVHEMQLQRQNTCNELKQTKSNHHHYQLQHEKNTQELEQHRHALLTDEQALGQERNMALDFCDQEVIAEEDLAGDFATLERDLRVNTLWAQQRDLQMGSIEEAVNAVAEKEGVLTVANQDVECTESFLVRMDLALKKREKAWREFRKYTSFRAKYQFAALLDQRRFIGRLDFLHKEEKLEVVVKTNASDVHDKDPRSLSGGEKSFSTICLLLALWGSMDSPIRALDEFDVFMVSAPPYLQPLNTSQDSVNRKISMKMLVEFAKSDTNTQYIFITPQSVDYASFGPDVKCVKLDDPTRIWAGGQQTLD